MMGSGKMMAMFLARLREAELEAGTGSQEKVVTSIGPASAVTVVSETTAPFWHTVVPLLPVT